MLAAIALVAAGPETIIFLVGAAVAAVNVAAGRRRAQRERLETTRVSGALAAEGHG